MQTTPTERKVRIFCLKITYFMIFCLKITYFMSSILQMSKKHFVFRKLFKQMVYRRFLKAIKSSLCYSVFNWPKTMIYFQVQIVRIHSYMHVSPFTFFAVRKIESVPKITVNISIETEFFPFKNATLTWTMQGRVKMKVVVF